ncbi:MAG: TRAP transporter small permease subunit [Rhodospirillum sp.]|nr:TRAP transporter small permease subunit [Rhodospirillum sp.]MCF8491781.1 TRAP transporter small permease subunit [Rhodospirillum sp.]MCF8501420.1 TRAP transporter small permease subunit [Rhodospirillum sp.]
MLKLARLIDGVNILLGKAGAWAVVLAIIISAGNAISRRFFGVSSNGWLEIQWYLFGAVFILCSPWTLKLNEHIRIDILSSRLSKRARNWVDLFGHLFFLIPFVAVMLWLLVPFFLKSYESGEMSPNAGGLPIWPAKGIIFFGFLFLALQAASELIKRIAALRGALDDDQSDSPAHTHGLDDDAEHLLEEVVTDHRDPPSGSPHA